MRYLLWDQETWPPLLQRKRKNYYSLPWVCHLWNECQKEGVDYTHIRTLAIMNVPSTIWYERFCPPGIEKCQCSNSMLVFEREIKYETDRFPSFRCRLLCSPYTYQAIPSRTIYGRLTRPTKLLVQLCIGIENQLAIPMSRVFGLSFKVCGERMDVCSARATFVEDQEIGSWFKGLRLRVLK
jgi:hypothetical protein